MRKLEGETHISDGFMNMSAFMVWGETNEYISQQLDLNYFPHLFLLKSLGKRHKIEMEGVTMGCRPQQGDEFVTGTVM